MKLTRRQMLRGLAVTSVAPLAIDALGAEGEDAGDDLIIDTHQHLWDLSKFNIPWLKDAAEVYRHSYRPQEYAEATRGLNVRSIYMEVDVDPAQRGAEAEYVIDLCRRKSGAMRAAVIGGHPASADFEAYIRRHHESGVVRGVRQVLQSDATPRGFCLSDPFVKGIRLLGKLGMSFDLCMRTAELTDGAKLADLVPETRFVLDHCGNADVKAFLPDAGEKASHDADAWKRDIDELAKRPNVICKISGIVAGAPEKWSPAMLAPIVNNCLDAFGPGRVVFGGDWPICLKRAKLAEWMDALKQIVAKRPAGERTKLWSGNAKKFYGIEE